MNNLKKILIIDDEPDVVTYFEALFQDHGYQTVVASNGVEAITLAKTQKPDLITLDITMPKQSGLQTFQQLKEDRDLNRIPVIIITAVVEDWDAFFKSFERTWKPEGFMSKPIQIDQLIEMASKLIFQK